MKPGSHHVAAEIVARALLEKGATALQAKIGAQVASFGEHCWVSDSQMQKLVTRGDGRAYHRESIGRARRLLARAACIESKRIFPTQTPDGAKFRSTHGTTSKRILWKTLGIKSPMTRGDRKVRRVEQTVLTRSPELATSTGPSSRSSRVAPDPMLMAMIAGIGSTTVVVKRRKEALERPVDRARAADDVTRESAADQVRRLEQWARDHERGPP